MTAMSWTVRSRLLMLVALPSRLFLQSGCFLLHLPDNGQWRHKIGLLL
jgi:hypothetical protein